MCIITVIKNRSHGILLFSNGRWLNLCWIQFALKSFSQMQPKTVSLPSHTAFLCPPFSRFPSSFISLAFHGRFSSRPPSLCSNSIIYVSSIKKSRSRKVKSNAELCNDIQEFLSTVGLPEDHVPSTRELSQHGRKDLANIVRRRGYKLIKELLAASTNTGMRIMENITEKQFMASDGEGRLAGQNEEDSAENFTLSDSVVDSSTSLTFEEKVANFLHNGELYHETEDSRFDILIGSAAVEGKGPAESLSPTVSESRFLGGHRDQVKCDADAAKIVDGKSGYSDNNVACEISQAGIQRNHDCSNNGLRTADADGNSDFEMRRKKNHAEINRLKFMLHQKELELSEMKQQIEKEKLALSVLQTKAEEEITEAQELISEKDPELQAAEESLSGLKEVEIEFWSEADTKIVEVAGSFNGWQYRIKMDSQQSPSTVEPSGSRKPKLWSTVLWLYPGVYEIKFIVDGQWVIDPQREKIMKDTVHNNILRVDS